jgi:hypothetical protein
LRFWGGLGRATAKPSPGEAPATEGGGFRSAKTSAACSGATFSGGHTARGRHNAASAAFQFFNWFAEELSGVY